MQGREFIRDLDIRRLANNKHGVPVPRQLVVEVKDGVLDIEFEKKKSDTTIAAVMIKLIRANR